MIVITRNTLSITSCFSILSTNNENNLEILLFRVFKNSISNETLSKQKFRDTAVHNARILEITLTLNEFIIFSLFFEE